MNEPLATALGALKLRNPVLVASGTYGSGVEVAEQVDLSAIGGVVSKSVTTRPRRGNPPPRIFETASGMLNSIGIMQGGAEAFCAQVLPRWAEFPCARVVNVAGESVEDFEALTRRFGAREEVDAIELNVSCPNVAKGLDFARDPALLEPLVARCRTAAPKPLLVKLSPNVTDLGAIALAAERGGADALSLVNTFLGMAIDWRRRACELGSPTGAGGLSGPAIKPLALHCVHRVARATSLPLVGIGGIASADDALEFVVAGASAVQIGTANFMDPQAPVSIAHSLDSLQRQGAFEDIPSLVGTLRLPGETPA